MVQERTGVVSMMGRPMTLLGPALKRGDPAPDFMLLDIDLKPLRLSDSAG